VKALHQAGIEVILDVVYNHTAEGGPGGPVYSYRGIDNGTYYLLKENRREYRNDTGTGNVLRTAHPAVRKLVLDSLRYWVQEAHVDGFRFDLASIFMRRADGSLDVEDPPIIAEISGDPAFAGVRLIAEAWDPATYQLGRSFPGMSWLQWNDRFRDDVRSWVKSDPGSVPGLMARLYGSDDVFPDTPDDAFHAYQSVNFVTAHDGFCLSDLVSYNEKHNEANGEGNRDGTTNNRSWNCGWEGNAGVPADVLELRKRQVKNFCCLLFLANGTPMLCAGDEFMNTQGGNNNPYNQDNETTWLDWDRLERHQDVFRFFQQMMAFRKRHPSLGRSRFWRGDISWYGTGPDVDMSHGSRTLAFCLHGAAEGDRDIYVMISAYWEPLSFTIQEGSPQEWSRVVDTALPSPDDVLEPGREAPVQSSDYVVGPRSVVVLMRR
jgi:isoamylase